MRKIYCDICKQETKSYRLLSLPYLYGGEVYQSYDEDDAEELCPACALELYHVIEKFKEEKRKKAGETMKIVNIEKGKKVKFETVEDVLQTFFLYCRCSISGSL